MKMVLIANELIALLSGPKLIVATISCYEGTGGKLIAGDLEHLRFGRPVELIALDRANSHLIRSAPRVHVAAPTRPASARTRCLRATALCARAVAHLEPDRHPSCSSQGGLTWRLTQA